MLSVCTAYAQYYSGKVGETISLPKPSTPVGYNGIMELSYSSDSKYLSVYSGTSSVKILSYFSGSETVRCDFTCYRESYSGGKLYYYYGTSTAYYYIKCSSSAPGLVLSASPGSGQVGAGTTVKLNVKYNGNDISGCDIYYTLNGSTPSKNSMLYESGVIIDTSCTLKAIAYKDGYKTSDVLTEEYTVSDITLIADPAGGNVRKGTIVYLYSNKPNASIRYTLNGSNPTLVDPIYKESEGIVINQSCTLKATAKINGANYSIISTPVMEWKFTVSSPKLALSATPSGGKVSKGSVVKLTAKSDGTAVSADIYYTLDGSVPTKSSSMYDSFGITINSDCTLKAIAYKSGYETSNTLISSYTIQDDVTLTANSYSRVYGEDNPAFDYTVSGGTITSGEPNITCEATKTSPVGTYDIEISNGSVSDGSVKLLKGTLTITKAPLTIKADDKIVKQGDPLPDYTCTYSGFKNNETESVLTNEPILTCTATESSTPGIYEISAGSAVADNYSISYETGTLIITDVDFVTVTAKNYEREFGEENPVFEYVVSGGSLKGVPAITCEASKSSDVGAYDIILSQGSIDNLDVQYVEGTLIVTTAPLTLISDSYTIRQGDAMPEFGATYSGFKNNDDENVFICKPQFVCEANGDSAPGTYKINVSGAEAKNYTIEYICGTLTILPNITSDELTVSTSSAGSLSAEIGTPAWNTIRSLTISGQINGTDIRLIRKMLQDGKLEELDLRDVKIVSGGEAYDKYEMSKTSEDVIGESMFYDCPNLKKIFLPSTTQRIESYAFFGCSGLKQLELPETCVSIGDYAIAFCEALTTMTLHETIVRIGKSAFTYCTSLSTIYSAIDNMDDVAKCNSYYSPFDGIADDCLWHVPAGTKEKYTSLSWWDKNWGVVEDSGSSDTAIEEENLDSLGTAVKKVTFDRYESDAWYTLRGMKVNGKPTIPGIYIHKGKKVVVR